MQKKSISIIGTGALGSTLAQALAQKGFTVAPLYNRSGDKLLDVQKKVDAKTTGVFPKSVEELASIIFITVADGEIRQVAEKLACLSNDFNGYMIIHCSGTKTSSELVSIQQKGAAVASFHPLQTFTTTSVPKDLSNIYFDMEGDEEALSFLEELAQKLGSQVLKIKAEAKPWLHAAAVMSSNYLVALMELASTIAEVGGLQKNEARKALIPLMQKSFENAAKADELSDALSGPIMRGDDATVKDHLKLLEHHPQALALYKQLGKVALKLARDAGELSEDQHKKLAKILA